MCVLLWLAKNWNGESVRVNCVLWAKKFACHLSCFILSPPFSFIFRLPLFFVAKGVKQCGGKVKLYALQDDATSSCKVLSVIMAIVVSVFVVAVAVEQF